jgi:uncharacterized membrane protein
MGTSLKSRVFWTDLGAWNNAWFVYVGAPLLAALGATIGVLWGAHLVSSELGEVLMVGGCIGVTMLVGFTILAVVDRRSAGDSV